MRSGTNPIIAIAAIFLSGPQAHALPADVRHCQRSLLEAPHPDFNTEDWLKATSEFAIRTEKPRPDLYRGINEGYFTLGRVVRNMLGDELAEHPSWRFSNIVEEHFGKIPTLGQWHEAKRIAATELRSLYQAGDNSLTSFANNSMNQTTVTRPVLEKQKSLGVASTNIEEIATEYAARGSLADNQVVCLRIRENIARASAQYPERKLEDYNEYYLPIVIPAADIAGASSLKYNLEKVANEIGRPSILIRVIANPLNRRFGRNTPTFTGLGRIIAKIVPCESPEMCAASVSEAIPEAFNNDAELRDIASAIGHINGMGSLRFRLVFTQ